MGGVCKEWQILEFSGLPQKLKVVEYKFFNNTKSILGIKGSWMQVELKEGERRYGTTCVVA
jgi:hypothetical protein